MQVEYSIDGKNHHDAIDFKFSVKSSFYPILVGSVIGSFIGFMLKDIFEHKSLIKMIQSPSWVSGFEIFFMDCCLCSAIVLQASPKSTGRWQGNAARAFEPC